MAMARRDLTIPGMASSSIVRACYEPLGGRVVPVFAARAADSHQNNAGAQVRILTARAATRPTVSRETLASTVIRILLAGLRGIVSVGEKAVALVNDT